MLYCHILPMLMRDRQTRKQVRLEIVDGLDAEAKTRHADARVNKETVRAKGEGETKAKARANLH